MNLIFIFTVVALSYCFAAPERVGERIQNKSCDPGSKWKEECHSCYCSDEGKIVCSKEACPPQLVPRNKRFTSRQPCREGESWKDDCHTCYCSGGAPACTRELCPSEAKHKVVLPPSAYNHHRTKRETEESAEEADEGDEEEEEQEEEEELDDKCPPGVTVWQEKCNDCVCGSDGLKQCTTWLCPSL